MENYVNCCKKIRVLNAIRHPDVGLFLTSSQYQYASQQMILKRLLNRNCHLLALKIANYLELDVHGILIHWACFKVNLFFSL